MTHGLMMDDLIYTKSEVLDALKEQLSTHKTIVKEAWEGYQKSAREQLEDALDMVKKGRRFTIRISIPAPKDHTKDIERAIKMLERSKGDEVVLTEQEFSQYIMGEWHWIDDFITSNSAYSMTAASL